jgi:hypothetical protein
LLLGAAALTAAAARHARARVQKFESASIEAGVRE